MGRPMAPQTTAATRVRPDAESLPTLRSMRAKWAYVTRRLPALEYDVQPSTRPFESGDFVVARVTSLAAHDHLEDVHGRRCRLYPGDLIVAVCGNRYATDAFEGYVPQSAASHLLTAGGMVGDVVSSHDALGAPSDVEILGHLALDGAPVTSMDHAWPVDLGAPSDAPRTPTIVVIGSSMNAGKTTTVTSLVRGFRQLGLRVGAGKVTGSGSGKDRWAYLDAGADEVADFLDFGMPSTFGHPMEQLRATMRAVQGTLSRDNDVVVLEIADGVLQEETAGLLAEVRSMADGVVVAVPDPLAAKAAVDVARAASLDVLCLSGLITRSPLAAREATTATGLPVLTPADLARGGIGPLMSAFVAR
jgi:hypothetical protein